jgi:hypothetical protein
MARRPVPIQVKAQDLTELGELLRGGVQQVRVVLRALALRLLADQVTAPQVAETVPLTKRDNEYKRCGIANVFGVVEPKAGRHFTTATPDRSAFQFAQVVYRLALQYPEAETVHLVMDNLNTHRRKSFTDLYGAEIGGEIWDRFTIHYTPKHGSWLDQAEIELSLFSRQCLGSRRISDLSTLQRETKAWNRQANRERTAINWRFTRRQARKTFQYQKPPRRRSP